MNKQVRIHLIEERKQRQWTQQEVADRLGTTRLSINRWEQGLTTPSPYWRAKLRDLFGKEPEELDLLRNHFVEDRTSVLLWHLPFPRNPFFTGREDILDSLHEVLHPKHTDLLTQSSALITGLGGIGKTQTAIEYAYRHAQDYTALFWINAETIESLMASFLDLADLLDLPEKQEEEQSRVVAHVIHWLNSHEGWLLIFDNVEEIALLPPFLPMTRGGSLLFTSRNPTLAIAAQTLNLEIMATEEGATFLLHRTRPTGELAPDELQPLTPSVHLAALEIVKLLGGLPLALDQAGAYLNETGCRIEDYLQRYHDQRQHILAYRGTQTAGHPDSVATTLRLSVESVEQKHPAAAELLRVCALLHPEAIPEELFVAGTSELEPMLILVVADPYQFDLALAALRHASLVTRHAEARTFSIHRLVQAVLQDQMEPARKRQRERQVVRLITAAFPSGKSDTWTECERLLAHALACVSLIERTGSSFPEAGALLYKVSGYLMKRGRYAEAEPLLERAIALEEQQHCPDHSVLLSRLLKRVELFWCQGKDASAEQVLHRSLALGEQHLGSEHPLTAETLSGLASLYHCQGKYAQAEPLYQRALRIRKQQMGSEHIKTTLTLNNLALLYRDQGTYEQAERLYQRALRIQEQQVGSEHPRFAECLANLARLYTKQGRYSLAEQLCQRALNIQEQALGFEHPEVAFSLSSLAGLAEKQGQGEQAMQLLHRASIIFDQRLGQDNPESMKARDDYQRLLTEKTTAPGTQSSTTIYTSFSDRV